MYRISDAELRMFLLRTPREGGRGPFCIVKCPTGDNTMENIVCDSEAEFFRSVMPRGTKEHPVVVYWQRSRSETVRFSQNGSDIASKKKRKKHPAS